MTITTAAELSKISPSGDTTAAAQTCALVIPCRHSGETIRHRLFG